ncbi:MAG: antibiotic biosynthesis monooxygenase family protein [Tetrasphaera sp.]
MTTPIPLHPATTPSGATPARVVFLVTVPPEASEAFLAAYERIRLEVADGVDGHIVDQVCRSDDDPAQWLITSEWESLAHFRAWERSEGHRTLVAPMRACMTAAVSLKFDVIAETRGDPARKVVGWS